MSLLSRAASSLVESLDKYKHGEGTGSKGSFVNNEHHQGTRQTISAPPRPPLSTRDGEMEEVLKLDVPRYDNKRQFPGLAKLKIEKKERHNKALDDFGKLLDNISEELEQNVLQLSLEMRESLESSDASFQDYYRTLEDNQFLIVRSEPDLVTILGESRERVAQRSAIVESFASELDELEVKRADIAGAELKKLVDKLIGIAHQLPDEIEHIVENETFDLNKVLTANRESHAKLLVMLRKTQVSHMHVPSITHRHTLSLLSHDRIRYYEKAGRHYYIVIINTCCILFISFQNPPSNVIESSCSDKNLLLHASP